MCGIAGYIGKRLISNDRIDKTIKSMKNRGPDSQHFEYVSDSPKAGNLNVLFLHSRLSIIDLSTRANQPLTIGEYTIIFNGEIYNYLELKLELETKGVSFNTTSDTEVLLQAYINFGDQCFKKLEGMWSFAIWNRATKELILSRDRFGEKPLYIFENEDGFYFASEIKMLRNLSGVKFKFNEKQILRYLTLGYKSLYKNGETFFEQVFEIKQACNLKIKKSEHPTYDLEKEVTKYWVPNVAIKKMSLDDAISGARHYLDESIRIRLRSDVPLAFCLSGGVDSSSLVSIASKKYNCDVSSFSIIEDDERYNEYENIMATVNDIGCKHTLINIPKNEGLTRLKKLIKYHDAPIATTTYYVHSLLSEKISSSGFKVAFSGTAADELYTGYYDHYLLHLNEIKNHSTHSKCLSDWQEHVANFIRNPILKDSNLYIKNSNFREHIFDNANEFSTWLKPGILESIDNHFTEDFYCNSLLRNRMLNELFTEITPVVLHEDDLNSMCYSIENRSPFLDTNLFNFMYSVPAEHLIKNGYAKFVLRESVKGVLNDKVRLDRQKKGFNASVNSLFDLKDGMLLEELFDSGNQIFDYIDRDKVMNLLNEENLPNHYSKFVFNFINVQIFLTDYLEG